MFISFFISYEVYLEGKFGSTGGVGTEKIHKSIISNF